MPNWTNKHDLPPALVKALTKDLYDAGDRPSDISVTSLIGPPRIAQLKKRHKDKIEVDVSERLWSMLGHAMHFIAELGENEEEIVEQRLYLDVEGWVVSGMSDNYNSRTGIISDYKCTSMFSFKEGWKPEWEAQLNMLAALRREHGYDVKGIQIIGLLKDWHPADATKYDWVPQCPVIVREIPIWSHKQAMLFMAQRVREHQAAAAQSDEDMPICPPEDRWESTPRYLVKGEGNIKATKSFDTKAEADAFAAEKSTAKKPYLVEFVPGLSKRCAEYCEVWAFCEFGRKVRESLKQDSE